MWDSGERDASARHSRHDDSRRGNRARFVAGIAGNQPARRRHARRVERGLRHDGDDLAARTHCEQSVVINARRRETTSIVDAEEATHPWPKSELAAVMATFRASRWAEESAPALR